MKKFYWKEFIKKSGKERFIKFIITILITSIASVLVIKEFGIVIIIESLLLSYIYDLIKDFRNISKEVNEMYSIENKKK